MKTVYYAGTSSSGINTGSNYSLSLNYTYSNNAITYKKGLYSNLVYNDSSWTFSSVIASGTLPTSASTSVSLTSDNQCIILTTSSETLLVKRCPGIKTYIIGYLNGSYYYPLALASSSSYVSNSTYMVSTFSLDPALYIRSSTAISYLTSNSSSAYSESWTDNFNRTTLLGTISSMRKTVTAIVVPTASNTITVTFDERPRIFFFNTALYTNAHYIAGSFICDTSTLNVQFYSYVEDYTYYSCFGIKITSSGHRTFTISETDSNNILCRTGYSLVITGIM